MLGLLALILGFAGFKFFAPPTGPFALSVYLTADIRGRLVPCGCFTGQYGGLTRVAQQIGSPTEKNMLLDAGDALEGPEDYHRIELGYIHTAFAKMGYEAANIGHREARLSAGELRTLAANSKVQLLSANLLDAQSGRPFLKSHIVAIRGGRKVAIAGVLDERIPKEQLGEGLRVEKMSTSIGQLIPSLKKEADFLILLAFTDEPRLRELGREFPEFCLVLGGKVSQPSPSLAMEGKTGILYVTNESKALGKVNLSLGADGDATVLSGDVQLVHDHIKEDKEIARLATAYRDEIRHTKLALDQPDRALSDSVPGIRAAPSFAGSEACTACHSKAAEAWKKSGHSHAFKTLVDRGADADPNCIGCHTVGFEKSGGYRREFRDKQLVNVGCESCHGPGSRHIQKIQAGDIEGGRMRKLGAADCVKCHHGEFSRPFVWDEFWPHVAH
jgi:hypothetical protein